MAEFVRRQAGLPVSFSRSSNSPMIRSSDLVSIEVAAKRSREGGRVGVPVNAADLRKRLEEDL